MRRFATQAGGQAWLRSEPGQGTTVTIVLPAADLSGQQSAQPGRALEHAGAE